MPTGDPPTAVYSVASIPMRTGDFSALNTSIWDPVGRSLAADGKTILATPFANNVIPQTRMSPQAAKLYEFEPLPNSPSESAANAVPLRNFRETQHGFSNKDQFHIRPDWVESPSRLGSGDLAGPMKRCSIRDCT